MNDRRRRLPHHPGLDGLRGLAVVAVLLYHGGFEWAEGGYLGVSVFFTLSGFLITSLLLAEHQHRGVVSLRAFWGRRFRRLLPAAVVALAGVCVFAVTVASPEQRRGIHGDVLAALAYVANWRFVFQEVAYADLFAEPTPVLHFWSLAIEEQFYVLFPPLVVAVLAIRRRSLVPLALILGVLTAASVTMSFVLADAGQDRIYFGTDTRAVEILVGALLAVAVAAWGRRVGRISRTIAVAAGVGALAALGWAASTVPQHSEWLYQGGFAAIALLSAVAVFAATQKSHFGTVLGNPVLAWIGLRSYGLYLYHWPIFLWLDSTVVDLDIVPLFVLRLAVTAAAAEASYHLIEMPFREQRIPRRVRLVLAPATVLAVALSAVAIGLTAPPPVVVFVAADEEIAPPPPPPPPPVEVVEEHRIAVIGGDLAAQLAASMAGRVEPGQPILVEDHSAAPCPRPCPDVAAAWSAAVSAADTVVIVVGPDDALGDDPDALRAVRAAVSDDAQVHWLTHPPVGAGIEVSLEPAPELVARFDAGNATTAGLAAEAGDQVIDLADLLEPPPQGSPPVRQALSFDADDPALVALVDSIAAQLVDGARGAPSTVRVLVVGDSLAQSVGNGIVAWSQGTGDVVAWNVSRAGCGLLREGAIRLVGDLPPGCRTWEEQFAEQIAEFAPDVVVVLTGPWDLADRRLPGTDSYVAPGDPSFDEYLASEYEAAVASLGAGGASIVWLGTPCAAPEIVDRVPSFLPERRLVQFETLAGIAEEASEVRLVDLDAIVCPGGEYTRALGGIADARYDGIHFSPEAASWLASEHIAPVIEELTGTDVARP